MATNLMLDDDGRLMLAVPPRGSAAVLRWERAHRGHFEVTAATGERSWVEDPELWETTEGTPLWRARATAFDHQDRAIAVTLWVESLTCPPATLDDFEVQL